MLPFRHALLQFLLSFFGAVVGELCGLALKAFGGEKLLGQCAGLLDFLVGMAGFLGVYFLWDRWVPIQCPNCGGRMMKENARWGRHFRYTCDSCGPTQ
jgi:hypothetical protein